MSRWLVLCVAVLAGSSGSRAWEVSSGPLTVEVNESSFDYSVLVGGAKSPWLTRGKVTLRCGNTEYSSEAGGGLVGGAVTKRSGTHPRLGEFTAIERGFTAGNCGTVTAQIRGYHSSVEFLTNVTSALNGTASCKPGPDCATTATGFPNLMLPAGLDIGFATWCAAGCGGSNTLHLGTPVLPPPADFTKYAGGPQGGPLVLYAANGTSVAVGPTSRFKVGVMARVEGTRLVGGAHGMVELLPEGYTTSFGLVGRQDGVTAAMLSYGSMLRRAFDADSSKLHLNRDVLSRQVHYVTDAGALLNYCDYWPGCVKAKAGCTPQGRTLQAVSEYHVSLGLNVGVYHVDPYWYSHTANGGCDDFLARNWSASPFHWPNGTFSTPMMLFLAEFASCQAGNVYCDEFGFEGTSISGADAERFFLTRFRSMSVGGRFKAMTLDNVQDVWWSSPRRLTDVYEQEMYDQGLSKAALAFDVPIRVDQQMVGDVLGSVQYGARTVARCTGDSDPTGGSEASRWKQLASNSLLMRAVGVRPMVDVLWTEPDERDPRWSSNVCRSNVQYDLITAVLTTGPVGFGDLISHTNASLLQGALRTDGTILKPASAALLTDRYYDPAIGGAFISIAPTRPAASEDPGVDPVANSMALLEDDTPLPQRPWGWSVLSTNLDPSKPSGSPLAVSELWPAPAAGAEYLVSTTADTGTGTSLCVDGAPATSCTIKWNSTHPLNVGTSGPQGTPSCPVHQFRLLSAAPLLKNGWVLLGDLTKIVPLSPQRIVVTDTQAAATTELQFTVIGSSGEIVPVTVATPSSDQTIHVFKVEIGTNNSTSVTCGNDIDSHGYKCRIATLG